MLRKIEYIFVCAGLSLLILLIFFAALLRFWGIDMSWSVDLAQLTFAWICFIGADLALAGNRHMGVDMVVEKLPSKVQFLIKIINQVLIFGFLIFILVYGIDLCIVNRQRSFQTLPISYSVASASAPVGALLMILTLRKKIVETFKSYFILKRDLKGE